jgi:hypothetical protein
MAEPPPVTIPFPPQFIASLASAIRTQTNALLEIKASLAVLAERLDRIVDAERAEADDLREIHRAIIDAGRDANDAKHAAVATRKDLTGPVVLHTPEQLEALKQPSAWQAFGVLAEKAQKLPVWLRILAGTSVGAALLEAAHKFLRF